MMFQNPKILRSNFIKIRCITRKILDVGTCECLMCGLQMDGVQYRPKDNKVRQEEGHGSIGAKRNVLMIILTCRPIFQSGAEFFSVDAAFVPTL